MPQYFDSTSAKPMKTKRSVYRGGGAVKNNRGMGVALKAGGVATQQAHEKAKARSIKHTGRKPKRRIGAKDGDWIQKANIKKGALREQMGIKKGKKIPLDRLKAAAKKGGKLGKRANLALTFRGMKK